MSRVPPVPIQPPIPEGYRLLPCGAVTTPAGRVAYLTAWTLDCVHKLNKGAPAIDTTLKPSAEWLDRFWGQG